MVTATSSRHSARRLGGARWWAAAGTVAVVAALLVVLATQHSSSRPTGAPARVVFTSAGGPPHGFSWLRPAQAPVGWPVARLASSPATLTYPPSWHTIRTDAGTASAALTAPDGTIIAYLNATPRQGAETLANWQSFRPHHVAAEGAREVRLLGSAQQLPFRAGRGSCVIESYMTTRTRYDEIACLVRGASAATVIVGAAQPGAWSAQGALLEQAIASFAS